MRSAATPMKPYFRPLAAPAILGSVLSLSIFVGSIAINAQPQAPREAVSPELAYLKQVNQWRPPSDPQLLFILMGQFANAGRELEGIAYFEEVLRRFGSELAESQRAQYLVAIAALRAAHANEVFSAAADRLGE